MPAVPFSALADPPFAVVHQHDAAEAFVAAARARIDEPLNVVAPGSDHRLPGDPSRSSCPGPDRGSRSGTLARGAAYLAGAPVPDHVLEMFIRGRLADNDRARDVLGFAPTTTTSDVIEQLYRWPSVVHTPAARAVA